MNREQAKEILMLYRPGSADEADDSFQEALLLCDTDHELQHWFEAHCATFAVLKAGFKEIRVPEGLKEQILAEKKVHTTPMFRRPALVLTALAAVAVLVGLISLWLPSREAVPGLPLYRERMVKAALRTYSPDLETDSLDRIKKFFQQSQAPANYTIPAALQARAQATGCARVPWQGQTVSMLCFKSGRSLAPGKSSDLWLLVVNRDTLSAARLSNSPLLAMVNGAATATWTQGQTVYLLVADGNEDFLRQYL